MTREDLITLLEEKLSDTPGNDQESKWKRQKIHISAAARRRGKSGKEHNAYVYGAMRKSGWKPKRERVSENVNSRVRKNIDTLHAHNAVKGSRDLEFKSPNSRRPGVVKHPVIKEAHRWLGQGS